MVANADRASLLLDRLEIRELIERYTMLLNTRDWDSFGDMLTEDFVWSTSAPINKRKETRAEMVRFLRESQTYSHGYMFQMSHGIIVDRLEGDEARARHTLHIIGDTMRMMGVYHDAIVREADGAWRFRRRDYQLTHIDATPGPGESLVTYPNPGNPAWYFSDSVHD